MPTTRTRTEIARDLMHGTPAESRDDHQRIADAIVRGDSADSILNMPETDRWPETYSWLKTELAND